jgi:hypothetical protein
MSEPAESEQIAQLHIHEQTQDHTAIFKTALSSLKTAFGSLKTGRFSAMSSSSLSFITVLIITYTGAEEEAQDCEQEDSRTG